MFGRLIRRPLLLATLIVTAKPASLSPAVGITAFIDVAVIPMDREVVLPHQTVVVTGDRITALGPVSRIHVPATAMRIDGRGKYLIPGLADMHTHIGSRDSASAAQALLLWLASGVTTIRNVDYIPPGILPNHDLDGAFLLRLRARAAAGTLLSPRIYTSGAWAPPQYLGGLWRRIADTSPRLDSIATYVAAYKAAGYDFLKIHDEPAVVAESVAAAARRIGLPVVGHVPADLPLQGALQAGFTSIEHLTGYLAALVRGTASPASKVALIEGRTMRDASDPAFLAAMRETLDVQRIPALAQATQRAGVWNCPTLELQALSGDDVRDDTLAHWPELRGAPAPRLEQWRAARPRNNGAARSVTGAGGTLDAYAQLLHAFESTGAGLLSGTDAQSAIDGYLVPGFALHRELAALVHAGLTPYQALLTSTRNVAAYFGTQAESGTVTVGKRADLVLLGGNPLGDIRETTHIVGVMRAGQWWPQATLAPRVAAALQALETHSADDSRIIRKP